MGDFELSGADILRFREQGFIGPFTLYSPDEARERYRLIRAALFDRQLAIYDLPQNSRLAGYDRHLDVDMLSEHICREEIVRKMIPILGPNIICWRSEFFPKYPGDEGTDWHQADTFAHASGKAQIVWPGGRRFGGTITVWTAMTDATEQNGCLRFIPGTHEEMFYDESKAMKYEPENLNRVTKDGVKRGFFGYDYRSLQKDPSWRPPEEMAVSVPMSAGQFVIFWSTLMHASFPNSTKDSTRLGYASRYLPASVHVYPDTDHVEEFGSRLSLDRYGVVLVSGVEDSSHNRSIEKTGTGFEFSKVRVSNRSSVTKSDVSLVQG